MLCKPCSRCVERSDFYNQHVVQGSELDDSLIQQSESCDSSEELSELLMPL